jgi:hypothetical protein
MNRGIIGRYIEDVKGKKQRSEIGGQRPAEDKKLRR